MFFPQGNFALVLLYCSDFDSLWFSSDDLVLNPLLLPPSHFALGDRPGHLSPPPPAPLPDAGAGAPSGAGAAGAAVAPAPVGLRVKSRLKSSARGARLLPPVGDGEAEAPLTKPERPVGT